MTANSKDLFTGRQVMVNDDFEFYHFENREPVAVDYHDHDFYEVFLFLSGNVDYVIEGRTYSLRPGDILITGVQELHKPVIRQGRTYERYVIWLQQDFIHQLSSETANLAACFEDATDRHYRLIRPDSDLQRQILQHFVRLSLTYGGREYGSDLLALAYLTELLVNLNRAYFDTSNQIMLDVIENEKINQIVEYINQHLGDDLSLDK
ncbi:MAG: AraC family transcriptional regulator, partial [Clostridiaceae bacterium]|nr:AraC family transcriptional regulator [Clostridiaceae bacterium]